MNLLIFFAIPLATILLAIVVEKILHCPILVAITFFSIYLIALFSLVAAGIFTDLGTGLVAVIIYTLIATITAYLVKTIKIIKERFFRNNNFCSRCANCSDDIENSNRNDLLRISCNCNNGDSQNLLTINSSCTNREEENNRNSNCINEDNGIENTSTRIFINR